MKKPFQIFLLPSHPLHFHPEEQCLQEGGRRVHGGLTSSQLKVVHQLMLPYPQPLQTTLGFPLNSTNAWGLQLWIKSPQFCVICRFWKKYEEETGLSDSVRKALLQVVRRHLTPPPSSTNVERLFSIGGLTATDHRAALAGEKLDQILFLRENALMANFKLGWEWSVINCCTYNISWNLE